jgi:hypothetical protein
VERTNPSGDGLVGRFLILRLGRSIHPGSGKAVSLGKGGKGAESFLGVNSWDPVNPGLPTNGLKPTFFGEKGWNFQRGGGPPVVKGINYRERAQDK